ncbi:MAG TPA: hypothetical protein DHV44_15130 [Providencia sp.]|nr:hypothetical protein [Providencia rettgeri]ELR5283502.1 hypothetical protein [Providencia rettgeri]HCI97599.1 hypothetical protein [Providencia sp.]
MFDWELDEPNDGLIFYYAQLAAKLVISGYDRNSAVQKIKTVNFMRDQYRGDVGVYTEDTDEWHLAACNYPAEVYGQYNQAQVDAIAKELVPRFS